MRYQLIEIPVPTLISVWRRLLTDWHASELSFLGRPRQISFRLTNVVIHKLNSLLKLSMI